MSPGENSKAPRKHLGKCPISNYFIFPSLVGTLSAYTTHRLKNDFQWGMATTVHPQNKPTQAVTQQNKARHMYPQVRDRVPTAALRNAQVLYYSDSRCRIVGLQQDHTFMLWVYDIVLHQFGFGIKEVIYFLLDILPTIRVCATKWVQIVLPHNLSRLSLSMSHLPWKH